MSIQRINNGKGHWYKIDGQKADGVTTLLGEGLRKKALEAWGIRTVAEYVADHLDDVAAMRDMGRDAIIAALKQAPYSTRDHAARRGTEVHAVAEKLVQGHEVDVPDEIAGHVRSYVDFLDEWEPKPVLVEAVVASREWNYAGTLDLVADLPDGQRVIADIKTSRSGIFPETVLQLAAYRFASLYLDDTGAEQPMADLGVTGALGIWVRSDGYTVYELDANEYQHNRFLHVACSARWQRDSARLIREAAHPQGAST